MDYRKYSAKDFALDKKFQDWVLAGDASARDFWMKWIKENPTKQTEIDEAKALVKLSGLSTDEVANEGYLKIWSNLQGAASRELALRRRNKFIRAAAVFLVFAVAIAYLFFNRTGQFVQHQTAFDETKVISLPDGSTVTLNANSIIRFESSLAKASERVVFLDGEAFFEVAKTADQKRFEVNTDNDVTVEVLGTVFNVDARKGKPTEVLLQEGKVKINHGEENVILQPGEKAALTSAGRLYVATAGLDEQNVKLGWKNGDFVFNDTPLSQICYELEDDYGLNVVVTDSSINQHRITAKVSGRNVDVLFRVLSETLGIKINQNGNEVVISPD